MALYLDYRPQQFDDIIGQAHIITTLKNQVLRQKTAHAYLFSGPRGVGKTTTARILAKALNCEKRKENSYEPCNECESCKEISETRSIDVIEIDAASHTGVDNVRENIIENAQFKPTKSKNKIFIIDEVHMLSTASFNALLKTLEEPPAYVSFILATTDSHKLPATIISRCQRFNYSKVPDDDMKSYIKSIAKKEGIKIDDEVIARITRKSEGCARDAVGLLDQIMASGEKHITEDVASLVLPTTHIELQLDFAEQLILKQKEQGLTTLRTLASDGVSLPHFAEDLIELLRVIMIGCIDIKLSEKELDLPKDAFKRVLELTKSINSVQMVRLIDLALKRTNEIRNSPLPQLPLEMLVIEWCMSDEDNDQGTTTREQKTPIKSSDTKTSTTQKTMLQDNTTSSITQPENQTDVAIVKNNDTQINSEQAKKAWESCVDEISKQMPSFGFILKMSEFECVEGNLIKILANYTFHKDKITEKPIREKIESLLSAILKTPVRIEVNVKDGAIQQQETQELQELATMLGGEVV
ncbi:MAG: DNA polymerase III subunit gamma/tau [Candidatus Magasanikbacteria bacterium]